jgi:exonuclease VII small subunit
MSSTALSEKKTTFEQGYERLKVIAERVSSDQVPVNEMCDLFAEGKGLDQALTAYLAEQKARVEAIERGEGDVHRFQITAPSEGEQASPAVVSANTDDFAAAPVVQAPAADDDIPF